MAPSSPPATPESFGISAVSRLTGISAHTLRIWERRYSVVDPDRTETKRREYSREDIRRLSLIKSLVDLGHSIGTIADLSTDQLETRLTEARSTLTGVAGSVGGGETVSRVAFAGSIARDELRSAADSGPGLRIAGEFSTLDELIDSLRPGSIDLLVIECPTLFGEQVARIQETVTTLQARRAIVIYRFAQSQVVEPLDKDIRSITAMRAPVNASELRLACLADSSFGTGAGAPEKPADRQIEFTPVLPGDLPPRRFSDRQLAEIARHSSVVQCECPQHLANLLAGLAAFESYSAECENRSDEDARLHSYLHRATADCRAEMEDALRHVMEAEGISIPQ